MKTLASRVHDRSILPVGLGLHGLGRQRPEAAERVPGAVTGPAPALPALFEQVGSGQLVPSIANDLARIPVTTVAEGVLGILRLCAPVDIRRSIVAGHVVFVESPEAWWARTDEGLRHEDMHSDRTSSPIAAESHLEMARLRARVELEDSPTTSLDQRFTPAIGGAGDDAIEGAHTPLVADFVQVLEANHREPVLVGGHK